MEQTHELAAPAPGEKAAELYSNILRDLPAFPPLAVRLAELAGSRDAQIEEVTELLRSDAALSADLLRRANSPAYGFASRIDTLHQALVLLGFDELRRVALASATTSFSGPALQAPELRLCWRHSLAVALLAEELARGTKISPERAYTAGVLHDIGRLGLLTARPEQFSELLREATDAGPIEDSSYFLEREAETFGFDHTEAGRWLAERWEMPVELRAVAGRHHDRASGAGLDLLMLIQHAVLTADALGFGVTPAVEGIDPRDLATDAPEELRDVLERDPEELAKRLRARIDALDGSAGSEEPEDEPIPEVVAEDGERKPEQDRAAPPPEVDAEARARLALPWAIGAVAALAAAVGYLILQG